MPNFFDEMYSDSAKNVRDHYLEFEAWLATQSAATIARKRAEADLIFRRVGITFAVYGNEAGTERVIPFDIIPRMITAKEWAHMEAGLIQRVRTLNMFIHDIYHDQNIVKAGIIPPEQIFRNAQYRPEMQGISVASDIYAHIAGVDIVRAGKGELAPTRTALPNLVSIVPIARFSSTGISSPPASISCARGKANFTYSRIIYAYRLAFLTCWKTAK